MSILSYDENPTGLHKRYIVTKVNGDPIDSTADYFTLRLDSGGDDPIHIAACRKAILVYAEEIKDHLPKLSADIKARYS